MLLLKLVIFFGLLVNFISGYCGRRGSPGYRVVENIFVNQTARDLSVFDCFTHYILKEKQNIESTPLFQCALPNFRALLATEENSRPLVTKEKLDSKKGCLDTQMSCLEESVLIACRITIDDHFHNARSKSIFD